MAVVGKEILAQECNLPVPKLSSPQRDSLLASIKFPKNFQPVGVSYKAIFVALATLQRHEIKVTSQQDCEQGRVRDEKSNRYCNQGSHVVLLGARQNSKTGGKHKRKLMHNGLFYVDSEEGGDGEEERINSDHSLIF